MGIEGGGRVGGQSWGGGGGSDVQVETGTVNAEMKVPSSENSDLSKFSCSRLEYVGRNTV